MLSRRSGRCRPGRRKGLDGGSSRVATAPNGSGEHLVEGAPGGAVQLAEVAGNGLQHVPLCPGSTPDGALVVFVGVDRLDHPVGAAGPWGDPDVVAVEPLESVTL